jgi:Ras-related protein Rab-11A
MAQKYDNFDYFFKLVLVGDSGVGKSNLLLRYTKNEFNIHSQVTMGSELASKLVTMKDEKIVKA